MAIVVFVGALALVLASAGDTLGYDYLAYDAAARRLLAGEPLYDLGFEVAGAYGLYLYPPPFILLVLPLAASLPADAATWVWIGMLIAGALVGIAAMPVSRTVRWWTLLLAGLMWPFVYSVKLGQVGPLLFLLFALGWRWLDRDRELGVVTAFGTLVKLQPAIIFGWALLRRRWAVLGWGAAVIAVAAIVTTLVTGPTAWGDFITAVGQMSDPVTTPHNFTPGAIAYQLGVSVDVANAIQVSCMATVGLVVVVAAIWAPSAAGYMTTVVASQLLSPVLWDHYAMILLLPVAYLLDRGRWWVALIPLALAIPVVDITPAVAYPICFAILLVAPLIDGLRTPAPAATTTEP